MKIDENLTWIGHINDTAIKLNRANAMLFKVREFVNKILKSICFAIFDCHSNYANISMGLKQKLNESAIHTAKKSSLHYEF